MEIGQKDKCVKIEYDEIANAAYLTLTTKELDPGRVTEMVYDSDKVMIFLDFQNDKLVGIEILGAKEALHEDVL